MSDEVFLGVAFTSGTEEVVIPFFDRGLPVEYELTRSIRVVSRSGRKKVGILTTDAKLMGGMDMRTFNQTPEWSIVTELKKQYDVSSVSPDTPIASDLDVLLVAQPSSLTQKQIDGVTDYVRKGGATLLFLDPFPFDNPSLSPELPKQPPGGPFGGGQPPEPKGNLRELLDLCGIDWPTTEIVWNAYNPHPKLADLQSTPEIVFIGKGSGARDAFNEEQSASAGLQEIVTLFPGLFRSKSVGSGLEFIPLLADRADRRHASLERRRSARVHGNFGHQPAAPPYSHGQELHACRPDHGAAPGRRVQRRHEGCGQERRGEEERRQAAAAGEDQRDRDRRPGFHRRAVLRAEAAEDRGPGVRQRAVRAQLRGRAGRR